MGESGLQDKHNCDEQRHERLDVPVGQIGGNMYFASRSVSDQVPTGLILFVLNAKAEPEIGESPLD